jgi:rhodanese-related sulfurtransferase
MSQSLEVTPEAAKEMLSTTNKATLIDVREPQEWLLSRVEGAELIPMGSVPMELQKLEAWADDRDLLVLCHHGVRSLQVVVWLRARGIENCYSIAGGIDRWSREVDTTVPFY